MKSKKTKNSKLSFPCSQERAIKEGLYFPRRRIRIRGIDKTNIYSRIEDQDFKDATEQEIEECYRELARQIKIFKKRYIKVENQLHVNQADEQDASLSLYKSTHKLIGKSCQPSDPNDHKDLLINLCKVIAEGRLLPDSKSFNLICKFVRELLPMHLIKDIFNLDTQVQALNIMSDRSNSLLNEEKLRNFMIENNILLNREITKENIQQNQGTTTAKEEDGQIKFNFMPTSCISDSVKNEQIESLNKICSLFHSNSL